jgi:hypothetical protein
MAPITTIEEEEKPALEPTPVYRCKDPSCKAWLREEFLPEDNTCPMCSGELVRSIKQLPPVPKKSRKAAAKRKPNP